MCFLVCIIHVLFCLYHTCTSIVLSYIRFFSFIIHVLFFVSCIWFLSCVMYVLFVLFICFISLSYMCFLFCIRHLSSDGHPIKITFGVGVLLYWQALHPIELNWIRIIRSVETDVGRWTLVIRFINVDAYSYLASTDLICQGYLFAGCTEPPDSKETKLGNSDQEASLSAGKNIRIVLAPCCA